jgi:hypothetical protein
MKMRQFFFCRGLLVAVLLASPDARAQMSPDLIMETYNSNISVITNGAINKSVMDKTIERNNAGCNSTSCTASRADAARPAASVSTAYTPTPALRQQTVQGYVNRLKTSNPPAAQAITANFGPGKYDYSKIYRDLTKDVGLCNNDAVDALAAYILINRMVVNNMQDGNAIVVPMARGVRAQVAPLLVPKLTASGTAAIKGGSCQASGRV